MQPHRLNSTIWKSEEVRAASEKSRAALLNLNSTPMHDLFKAANVEKLFIFDTANFGTIGYHSYVCGDDKEVEYGAWEWGKKDMMLNLQDATAEQRMAILTAAANLGGGALHLLNLWSLTEEEERGLVEALSLAADRAAAPGSFLIQGIRVKDAPALLRALRKNNDLKHLSLQDMEISDECMPVLSNFASLTTLELLFVNVSSNFVASLAVVDPHYSLLALSLHRLHMLVYSSDWRYSTGFLHYWPQLKELSLHSSNGMTEGQVMNFMMHLAKSPLYSLELGFLGNLSRSATAAVVDALSRSGLPFFSVDKIEDPAIEAQLKSNQRNFILALESTRVPATSMRLFICGDPFAGKTTLVSTMQSIHTTRKRDKCVLRALFPAQGRTRGIQVRAIEREGIRLSLWDMAGQQEFHAFHDCMFPDIGSSSYQFPSLFLFVWSPMETENRKKGVEKTEANFEASFRYWLKFLASKSRQSNIALRVIVVFTRADQMEFDSRSLSHSINSLRSEFQGVIHIVHPAFKVDARKKDSVEALEKCIFGIAKEMLRGIQVYSICTQVSECLSNHLKITNQRIITWERFSKICPLEFSINKAILKAIALCLNGSGNIIYINGINHIVLDPNWFCNQIMGSLISISKPKASKGNVIFDSGFSPRDFLEGRLESVIGCKVKGSLLVDLMEGMHLCCKVSINHGFPSTYVDLIFIPSILTDVGVAHLQWRSSPFTCNVDEDYHPFVHIGRRLQCEDQNLTFLTPGLFPRIQVLFNNVFQSMEENSQMTLGKDFIYICFPDKEIIIVFCKAKSDHVIDVLVRAHPINSQQCDALTTLAYVEKHIIKTLITICAQPTGIQGVKLIQSVIRPDSLHDPSRAQDREDQCVEITYLKEQLRIKLLQGKQESYEWKKARQTPCPLQNDFIDLLGYENYEEVLISCKAWLKQEAENSLLESMTNEESICMQKQSQQNMITTSLENGLLQHRDDQILEEVTNIEVQSIKALTNSISTIYPMMDANHKEVLEAINRVRKEFHDEIQNTREVVVTTVEKSIDMLLNLAKDDKAEKQLPCVVILTTNDHDKKLRRLVTSLVGVVSVHIRLYCEDATLPHPVENQPGILVTSWPESHRESLCKALPYINFFFSVLTTAIKLGINSVAPLASAFIPNWTPHLKLAQEHPMISSTIKSKFDRSTSSKSSYICPTTLENFNEWQKCLAFILEENGGVTKQNIAEKFCLWHAKIHGGTQVAWLCKKHYEEHLSFLPS